MKPHRKDDLEMSREDDDFTNDLRRMTSPEVRLTELIEKLSQRIVINDEESRRRDEENQRNINFILGQQAQFSVDMQQLRETQARAEQKWENTANGINTLLAIAEIHEREINALAEAQEQAAKAQAEAQARTDRQMAETDERLNALVNVVEKMISDRRNGG